VDRAAVPRTVDLTACKPLGAGQPDGTLRVALVVHAQDRQGNPSNPDAAREVVIDPDVAVLTTTAPARAAPGAPLTFTVTSDRDLQGAPQVVLGETVATVTGGPRVFTVSFAKTPGSGSTPTTAGRRCRWRCWRTWTTRWCCPSRGGP